MDPLELLAIGEDGVEDPGREIGDGIDGGMVEDELAVGVPDPHDVQADQERRILVGVVLIVVFVVEHQPPVVDLHLGRRGRRLRAEDVVGVVVQLLADQPEPEAAEPDQRGGDQPDVPERQPAARRQAEPLPDHGPGSRKR